MSSSSASEEPQEKQKAGFSRSSVRRWAPHLLALSILLLAFRHLFTLGTRYGFSQGVEYWLFRPNDNAPLVILGLSLWLFYRRSNRLRALPLQTGPWWFTFPCALVGILIFFWALYTSAFDLQVFSLIFLSAALFASYWGLPGVRAVWLPIAFLLFAIPLPAPLLLA
ncbi:MAG: archaeosortase/exosortase family protein, partial [Myxococcota bacterium]|nr:archaeosortase/exosortase family protein [Myxococcota bacterium]